MKLSNLLVRVLWFLPSVHKKSLFTDPEINKNRYVSFRVSDTGVDLVLPATPIWVSGPDLDSRHYSELFLDFLDYLVSLPTKYIPSGETPLWIRLLIYFFSLLRKVMYPFLLRTVTLVIHVSGTQSLLEQYKFRSIFQ